MSARILLVEDAPDVQLIVSDLLTGNGYEVTVGADGEAGLRLATGTPFDLIILDVMLPGMNGFALCRAVRERGFDGGILMLTARTQVDDRVEGLTTGADDYLLKPFDPKELLARLAALLRRTNKETLTPVICYEIGGMRIDFETREVRRDGHLVNLAGKEFLLLKHLINHRGQVLTREQLLAHVWHDQPFIGPRTVDVHIAWLRQKLEDEPQSPRFILTERGAGYRFAR